MFKVTVLKAKDVAKIFMGISLTILLVLLFSKNFGKKSQENKLKNLEINLNSITNHSMVNCMDQVIPTMSKVNEEYKKIAKEDESEGNILQVMLKTQISSIKGMEQVELKAQKAEQQNTEDNKNEEKVLHKCTTRQPENQKPNKLCIDRRCVKSKHNNRK